MSQKLALFLSESIANNKQRLNVSKSKVFRLSLIRTILFLASIFVFYRLLNEAPSWMWYFLVLLFASFLKAVSIFIDEKARLKYLSHLQQELDEEQLYVDEKELSRPAFSYQSTEEHPFARDLNLFGAQSLHHHLNRSLSLAGSVRLKETLEETHGERITAKQSFTAELGDDRIRNFHLRALGRNISNEEGLMQKLGTWANERFKAIPTYLGPLLVLGSAFAFYRLYLVFNEFNALNFQVLIYAMGINLLLLMSRMKVIRQQQAILGQLSEAMKSYSEIFKSLEEASYSSELGREFLNKWTKEVKVSLELGRLSKYLNSLDQMSNAVVLVIINGFFPYHLLKLRSLEFWHRRHAAQLPQWIEELAEWETYMSIANYCDVHADYIWPSFSDKPVLSAKAMGHPLIPAEKRVNNNFSFEQEQFVILTGSNMSGKSTFLRTLGLNLVLAQIGAKVCAEEFHIYPFQVLASMSPTDNLHDNKSYFQAEVLRLKMLSDKLSSNRYSMLLLDEILRGTNSDDKKEGSRKFMLGLRGKPAYGMLATHDVDIAELAENHPEFSAYFFESQVKGQDLLFDYQLRPGVCRTPNANLLMQNYGLFNSDKLA